MKRVEVDEFLDKNDTSDMDDEEEVIGGTVFIHVKGQPRCFLMPFVVHKMVMTKDLACILDAHFVDENPMVIDHDVSCLKC